MTEQPEALRVAHELECRALINEISLDDDFVVELDAARLLREQHAALEKKSDAIQRLWKERDQLRAEVERLREALNEMLDESMDGIAICALTKIKARNALGRKP